ncbi:hypothetical protein AWH62_10595 [Maricaulis sp. W15]|uniref:DUF2163 domain-containing protein n=1 Tax=Maricaulis sp. W15 TaxID=1772333 RepID=UPI000948BF8C|nr:DUF2163 domain-containing protein [Maricaulis sp. W15]OLF72277.1 hypothetical protein AWH62_10595 [Maricaulis sp. W15]
MRTIPTPIQAALDRGVSCLCQCWIVTRTDNARFGFTDHDRDLVFAGVTCRAGTGFGSGDMASATGLAPDQAGVVGALDDAVLRAADLEAGLWSGARVEVWRVDWSADPPLGVKTGQGELGEIRAVAGRFEAELFGLSHRLSRLTGRVFARRCDAELGDARCGVDPGHPGFAGGCDKAFATCRDRFANTLNFRGFPWMVGNDVLQASPAGDAVRDGSSRGLGG